MDHLRAGCATTTTFSRTLTLLLNAVRHRSRRIPGVTRLSLRRRHYSVTFHCALHMPKLRERCRTTC